MEQKQSTLQIIQTISKIAQIVTKVLMVVCIVTGALCIVGIITLALGFESFTLFGINFHSIIVTEAGMETADMYISMITGIIMTVASAIECGFAQKYFKNEMAAGTPFTFDGAKEMLRLGIIIMAVSLGATTVAGIVEGISEGVTGTTYHTDLDIGGAFTMGLMFLMMSFVCKHGAEINAKEIENK